MNRPKITFIISLLLALTFVYTAGLKLWGYVHSKTGFDFFPFVKDYHQLLFWGLIVMQLALAGCLLFRRLRLTGLYATFFLLVALDTYLYVMLHYADHVPCFCTGVVPGLSWNGHLWFTIGFTLLAGTGIALLPNDIHARG
ncbi:MauE/DoxX family redox-associated membrane protein [Pedobacter africanus]|uniref:Methylamine utilisation protein MauE domain-containing protein n=1 Tax=Pedobacter africanus TaxID=151894 RepID=A0A1W2CTW8_9SPHI|nr:MauE/DoxX family redox-associated membrane protein [Pedobacter africanus]SMC88671.1 hypothetical protein SAMN04488524_3218 [Pedobacter africanus]